MVKAISAQFSKTPDCVFCRTDCSSVLGISYRALLLLGDKICDITSALLHVLRGFFRKWRQGCFGWIEDCQQRVSDGTR